MTATKRKAKCYECPTCFDQVAFEAKDLLDDCGIKVCPRCKRGLVSDYVIVLEDDPESLFGDSRHGIIQCRGCRTDLMPTRDNLPPSKLSKEVMMFRKKHSKSCSRLWSGMKILRDLRLGYIKGLSVKQPWVNMIFNGKKTIETRTWETSHRGTILICSSQKPKIEPFGHAVGLVRIVECRPMVEDDVPAACCKIYPKAFSWPLIDIVKLKEPFPIKGMLRMFSLDSEIINKILKDLTKK